MKKVLIISDSFKGYGAEHILKWLGNSLCKKGYEVTFVSLFEKDRNAELDRNATSYCVGLKEKYNLQYFTTGLRSLRNICKRKKYDFAITFHTNPYLMALLARPFCGYKLIHSERDNPYARDTFVSKLKMWLYRYADKVVFQTEGAQKFFDKKIIRKSTIIPNPIILPENEWIGIEAKTIVTVGRLHIKYKRQDVLLKAFRKVLDTYPDYKLVLYGDGPDREALEQQAGALLMAENVLFKGKVANITDKIANEGIFVLSSDSEGMPNALMEAMALGMPVISTDCEPGGAKALIDDGVNGLIVKRADADELSKTLISLISDVKKRTELGVNAREKMKEFQPERIIEQWKGCFKQCVK